VHQRFLKWLKDEAHITERISIPKIKRQEKVPALLSEQQGGGADSVQASNRMSAGSHDGAGSS